MQSSSAPYYPAGNSTKLNLKNKFLIFIGGQFCYFDLVTRKWDIGDCFSKHGGHSADAFSHSDFDDTLVIPDSASVISLDASVNWADHVPCIVSGGVAGGGLISEKVFGLNFIKSEVNGMRVLEGNKVYSFPDLPSPRFLHQSVAARVHGNSYLYVIGGKQSPLMPNAENTVFKLRIHDMISKTPEKTKEEDKKWIACAPMLNERSLFATCVVDKFIYAYGGISGSKGHMPSLTI